MSVSTVTSAASGAPSRRVADVIREHLARYVGPFTAKNAVQLHARQALGVDADTVTHAQCGALLDALGPLVRTLIGKQNAERVLAQLKQELGA